MRESSRSAAFPVWDWPVAQVVITEPLECLTHAPQFSELREYELNRFADPSVGMKHDLTDGIAGIANRKPFEQFAAARFGLLPC